MKLMLAILLLQGSRDMSGACHCDVGLVPQCCMALYLDGRCN
jgi:hypothetical protein